MNVPVTSTASADQDRPGRDWTELGECVSLSCPEPAASLNGESQAAVWKTGQQISVRCRGKRRAR